HGPYTSLAPLELELSHARWGCQDITQFCEVKIHDGRVVGHCHPINHLHNHCNNHLGADPNTCGLDHAVHGSHYHCSFCCLDKACVLSAKIPASTTAATSAPATMANITAQVSTANASSSSATTSSSSNLATFSALPAGTTTPSITTA
ncbi:hypothetical protein EGW08_009785, partial [Elysia chlorotica]